MLKKIITNQTPRNGVLYRSCEPAFTHGRNLGFYNGENLARKVERDLLDTATHHYSECLGLSANQLGYDYRAFAMRIEGAPFTVVFNPKVVGASGGMKALHERCLSRVDEEGNLLPGIRKRRPKQIIVEVLQLLPKDYRAQKTDTLVGDYFRKERLTLKGMAARVFLHELDHLNGKEI